jgi:hypothetical protein
MMAMSTNLTDKEIYRLIHEIKPLPEDYRKKINVRQKRGHKDRDLEIKGADGNDFKLIIRQSIFNSLDFSIILAYKPPQSNQIFRLQRYNGKSHEHTNIIENIKFYGFHIHKATERYQEIGAREDAFAEQTNRFSDFHGAIDCMMADCGFQIPKNPQLSIFSENLS